MKQAIEIFTVFGIIVFIYIVIYITLVYICDVFFKKK